MKSVKVNSFKKLAAGALLLCLCITLLASLVGCGGNGEEPFDYMGEDLTKYLTVDKALYHGKEFKIGLPAITDLDVEVHILSQLKAKKGQTIYDGEYRYDKVLYPGDKAFIYYRGYEIDENGNKKDLAGTCNFNSTIAELELGSGSFVPGFELGLVGKIPGDYSEFKKITGESITDTDVVYITATYSYESGEVNQNYLMRIDLGDENLEKKFGTGIREYVKSLEYGVTKNGAVTFPIEGEDDKLTILSAKLEFITRCEDNPIVVKTVFPYDYKQESFRNKTVYFDVYVDKALHYEGIMLTDESVTGKLGVKAEELEEYEGESITEKYRAMIRAQLVENNKDQRQYLLEEALWAELIKKVEIKRLPDGEVRRLYNEYYDSLRKQYLEYGIDQYYPDFGQFLSVNFELSAGEDPTDYMRNMVKEEIKEKLIFYSIIKNEGFIPSEEEFLELYDKIMKESFELENTKEYDSEEAYNKAFLEYKSSLEEKNGVAYYREIVYYQYGMEKVVALLKAV